jgi:hypothetical protein
MWSAAGWTAGRPPENSVTRRDSPGRRIGDAGRRPRLVGRDKDLAHIVAALDSGVSSAGPKP